MSDYVFDASALLALLLMEPGEVQVAQYLTESRQVSAVNFTEVITKLVDLGYTDADALEAVRLLRLDVVDFDSSQAELAAFLRRETRFLGLSLGDRACIGLAKYLGCEAVTADRAWGQLNLGVQITCVR